MVGKRHSGPVNGTDMAPAKCCLHGCVPRRVLTGGRKNATFEG